MPYRHCVKHMPSKYKEFKLHIFLTYVSFGELKSSTGFMLSLLLKIVQNTQSKNAIHVLQRFIGTQLFAESICSSISVGYGSGTFGQGTVVTSVPLLILES